jgi:hypothetical protein
MKPIEQNEIYDHFSGFLKSRGIELKAGSYSKGIQKGCSLLADAINLSQKGIEKAKSGIDEKLDQMRQVIHEKTAPKSPTRAATASAPRPAATAPKPARAKSRRKAKPGKSRAKRS